MSMNMNKKMKPAIAVGIGMDPDWQADQDLRTLTEAHKIKKDPKRHKAAKAKAKKKLDEMEHVIGKPSDDATMDTDDEGDGE